MKKISLTLILCLGSLWGATHVVAQEQVYELQYLVGEKARVLDDLSRQGYSYVRTEKSGNSSYAYYRDSRTGRCLTARTANGRVASIVYAPDFDCRSGGQGGDDWGGSGTSRPYGVTLHRDPQFRGSSETFTRDVPDMRRTQGGDDAVTSVSISRGCRARLYRDLLQSDLAVAPGRVASSIEWLRARFNHWVAVVFAAGTTLGFNYVYFTQIIVRDPDHGRF